MCAEIIMHKYFPYSISHSRCPLTANLKTSGVVRSSCWKPPALSRVTSARGGNISYKRHRKRARDNPGSLKWLLNRDYFTILVTTPAPTVRPPSRIAKRRPWSIATGASNFTLKVIVSPGITISLSAGNSTSPVTSVVRK